MSRYYTKLSADKPIRNCDCCERPMYGHDPAVTELKHISPITHQWEYIYKDRYFCRDCATLINEAVHKAMKDKVREHRVANEGGQLALFS